MSRIDADQQLINELDGLIAKHKLHIQQLYALVSELPENRRRKKRAQAQLAVMTARLGKLQNLRMRFL